MCTLLILAGPEITMAGQQLSTIFSSPDNFKYFCLFSTLLREDMKYVQFDKTLMEQENGQMKESVLP